MNLRVTSVGSPQFVTNMRGSWNGTYYDPKSLSDFLVERVKIYCSPPVEFQIGGDPHGLRDEVTASVTKQAIELVDYYES